MARWANAHQQWEFLQQHPSWREQLISSYKDGNRDDAALREAEIRWFDAVAAWRGQNATLREPTQTCLVEGEGIDIMEEQCMMFLQSALNVWNVEGCRRAP